MTDIIADIDAALDDLRQGRMLIIVDDEDRENEGDLLMAASCVRPADVNFMATHGRGLICQAITGERAAELELQPMVPENSSLLGTAFTVSIDARDGTSTGISASDRAATIAAVINPKSTAGDLLRPGHVFPLTAHPAGVLGRRGHTEAGVDLARMAGLYPSAVICEVMDADGNMARRPQLEKLAVDWGLRIASVQDIIAWRLRRELRRVAETGLPTDYGFFRLIAYNPECFALVKEGENSGQRAQRGQRAPWCAFIRNA